MWKVNNKSKKILITFVVPIKRSMFYNHIVVYRLPLNIAISKNYYNFIAKIFCDKKLNFSLEINIR